MQYTIRNVPREVDKALRKKAKAEGKSLNQLAIDALRAASDTPATTGRRKDLDWFFGSWAHDPEFDRALAEMDQIHPDEWK